jgi:ABC-type nitrate/sulfonate/bicarbonate transport system permease component
MRTIAGNAGALARRAGPAVLAATILVLAWEAYVRIAGISPTVLPAPSRIAVQIAAQRAVLWQNLLPTLIATLCGFALSMTAAFAFSLVFDFQPALRRAILPLAVASQTLPLIAIAPLVVLWFGFGLLPKVLLVAFVTFFPMLVALLDGYRSTDAEVERLLRSMGASRRAIFMHARLPSAVPYFFAGLRISITYAVVGAIFAEYAGAVSGLGIYMLNAKNSFRPDLVLAGVFISAALTLVLFGAAVFAQRLALARYMRRSRR